MTVVQSHRSCGWLCADGCTGWPDLHQCLEYAGPFTRSPSQGPLSLQYRSRAPTQAHDSWPCDHVTQL